MSAVGMISATRPDGKFGQVFWERLCRSAGIQSVGLFMVAYFIYDTQPDVAAVPEALTAFYGSGRAHILVAAAIVGLAVTLCALADPGVNQAESGKDDHLY